MRSKLELAMARIETFERLLELIPEPSPVASAKLLDHLDDQAQAFIARSPFVLMATESATGLEISPKGDDPGFVEIVHPNCVLIPERPGNQLKMGLRNILANGRIGLMFLCPATGDALRITGRATLLDDPEICDRLASHGKSAILAVRVEIDRAFFHCPRAILRAGLWKPETWGRPIRVSMGKVIGAALGKPEIADTIDAISDQRTDELWI
jgi:PPOX class probable FMN-dependent enzyme